MKNKRWMVVAAAAVVLSGWYVYRTYPRHVAITIQGIQYQLGAASQRIRPVTLTVRGSRDRSLFGPEKFFGTVNISGASMPDRGNGQYLQIVFAPGSGGILSYYESASPHYYYYGALFPNQHFTRFTVTEWQQGPHGAGFDEANGLVISAPAKTRAQALRMSNELMKSWSALLTGYPLK